MNSDLEILTIEQLAAPIKNAIVGGPFGSNLVSKDYVAKGVPVIRGQNMGEKWVGGEFVYVSEEKAIVLAPNKARPGDLVFTQRGTLGQVSIVPAGPFPEYIVSQSQMKLTPDPAKVDVNFLYYCFRSPEQQDYIQNSAIQTGVPHTNLGILKKTPIAMPPLVVQRQIAGVLKSLDDRITLLRETNQTLEAIAQALFKSWFVDFDPVRAKVEGQLPQGMDEATAALFPDSFETSEVGEIPRGWSNQKLVDICSYLNRGISPKYIEDGGVLVLNQKCIRDLSVDYTKARRHNAESRKVDGRFLSYGDVVVNSTGVGTLGRVAQILEISEPMIVDSHVTVVRAGGDVRWTYLGEWAVRKQPEIEAMGEGSTGQTELSRTKLGELWITVPSDRVQTAFDSLVVPLKHRISVNRIEARTLANLRDLLLPRLISGQLRLPDAEAEIEALTA